MKKRLLGFLLGAMLISVCVGCGTKSKTTEQPETPTAITTEESAPEQTKEVTATPEEIMTPTPEPTEELHVHNYAETITTEATCEMDGLKTFTCECGNSYTEPISATGHIFENYVYNEDATYFADGTETATCTCGLTDTRAIEGSKLKYTYTDMSATMYAQQTVNVRDLPDTSGNKLGALSTNDEIAITGQCNETGWYRFDYNGNVAYVSNKYVGENKVEVQVSTDNNDSSDRQRVPSNNFENYVWYDMGDYFFIKFGPITYKEWVALWIADPKYDAERDSVCAILRERYPDRWAVQGGMSLGGPEFTYVVSAVGHYWNGVQEVPKWDDVTYIELY